MRLQITIRLTFTWSRRARSSVPSCRCGARLICNVRRTEKSPIQIHSSFSEGEVGSASLLIWGYPSSGFYFFEPLGKAWASREVCRTGGFVRPRGALAEGFRRAASGLFRVRPSRTVGSHAAFALRPTFLFCPSVLLATDISSNLLKFAAEEFRSNGYRKSGFSDAEVRQVPAPLQKSASECLQTSTTSAV